jgi:pyruvate/2-oxoglutarate/acetoin dehydrogenase E1 component
MNVRDALNLALDEELARDPLVYVMGEEVLLYSHSLLVLVGENQLMRTSFFFFVIVRTT